MRVLIRSMSNAFLQIKDCSIKIKSRGGGRLEKGEKYLLAKNSISEIINSERRGVK